jgi:TPR repeat protein
MRTGFPILRKIFLFVSALTIAPWSWADRHQQQAEELLRALIATRVGDYQSALPIFRRLAAQGYPSAQHNLGVMYEHGHGVFRSYQDAFDWYRKAAEQGYAKAQYNLGVMYDGDKGIPQDNDQAFIWYRKAAQQNLAEAQFNLGIMYAAGQGAPRDDREAYIWYRRAAEQGHPRAQHNLAVVYANGQGAPQDYVQAYKWFSLAAKHGPIEQALAYRNRLAGRMTNVQIDEARRLTEAWRPTSGFLNRRE